MKSYISKLIDRNHARRRESGLTVYALFSLLLLDLYQVLTQFPSVAIKLDFSSVIIVTSYCSNFLCCANILGNLLLGQNGFVHTTTIIDNPSLKVKSEINLKILLLILTGSNFYTFIYALSPIKLLNFFALALSLFYFLVFYAHFIRKKKLSVVVKAGTLSAEPKGTIRAVLKLFAVLTGSYSLYMCYTLNTYFSKVELIKFIFLVLFIPLILQAISGLIVHNRETRALENFEYEIYANNLDDGIIRGVLQKKYFGYFLPDWLKDLSNESLKMFNHFTEEYKVIEKLREEFESTDELDRQVKLIELKSKQNTLEHSIKTFYLNRLKQCSDAARSNGLDPEEYVLLTNFYSKLNEDYDSFSNRFLYY